MLWSQLAVYLLLCTVVGSGFVIASWVLSPKRDKLYKFDPYECGVPMVAHQAPVCTAMCVTAQKVSTLFTVVG